LLKLQKIQIQGFKSFADRTELIFKDNGVIAIVGPNGCGKSNISDAIAWVLGEQSVKSLRGGRMEDVIFNGTHSRLPLGLAEVTLTFVDPEVLKEASFPVPSDQSGSESKEARGEGDEPCSPEVMDQPEQGALTAAPHLESAAATRKKKRPKFYSKPGELVVSRRLFRSGESEYLINGRLVRLRDIQDTFLGTGLGPDSYAIIEQGRVGLILSSKPSDRRSIIEEAAGVTKFKSKRKLAESKLEYAKQNLLRVNDITEEVSKQLASLKRQAAKARRYSELRDRMREVSKKLFSVRASNLGTSLEQNQQQLHELTVHYQRQHQCIEKQDTLYHQSNSSIFNFEGQLKQVGERLSQLNLEADRGRQRIEFQKEQLRELRVRSTENTQEVERLTQQEQLYGDEVKQKRTSLEEATKHFERSRAEFETRNVHQQGLQAEILELESLNDRHRSQLLDCVGNAATLRNQLLQLDESERRLEQQIARLKQERAEAVHNLSGLSQAHKTAEQQYQGEGTLLLQFKEQISLLSQKLADLREEETLSQLRLDEGKEQCSAKGHRLRSLEELAAHHAYSTEAVRLLLSVAKESAGSGFQTPGILADLIEVEAPHEATVEEFLKQELEFLLVESAASALEGISLLRKTGSGRSTFLLCANGRNPNSHEMDAIVADVTAYDSSLIPLRDIIKIPPSFETAAWEALPQLFRAFIVPEHRRAWELAQQYPQLIFLTEEGEVFRGRLVSGGGKAAGGHLSLKREIRELDRQVAALQKETLRQEEKVLTLRQSVQARELELTEIRQQTQDLEKTLVASDLRLKQILSELERTVRREKSATLELQMAEEEKAQIQTTRSHYQEEIAAADSHKVEIDRMISADRDRLKHLKDLSSRESQLLSELRSELATFRERKLAFEAELNRLDSNLGECQERISRLNSQKSNWSLQAKEIEESNRQMEELLFNQMVQKASLEAEIRSRENELAESRGVQMNLEQGLKLQRTELEAIQEEKTRLEIESARLNSDFSHLQEICYKELGVSLKGICLEDKLQWDELELSQLEGQYQELKNKMEGMGAVNMMALEEYQECDQRHQFLSTQRQDLLSSIEDTNAAIKEIDQVSREQFREAFQAINENFQESFKSLFGGGHGEMKLMDEQDELESGIEIIAQPPGKRLQNVLLLSGGEKALTAIALLLAIFKFQPSPFCVLDEVDAALDEMNIGRFSQMIKLMSLGTQFILITHSKKTMEVADSLYGVTMQEAGVSKLVSVQFE
jgi:chromosome segregation protein